MPEVTKENRGLYKLVFWFLGVALLGSIAGWIVMVLAGKTVPEAFPVMIGTIIGGLVGVIAPNRGG